MFFALPFLYKVKLPLFIVDVVLLVKQALRALPDVQTVDAEHGGEVKDAS